MTTRTVDLVPEWDSVPFDGGYEGLRALSEREFSGAVTAGPAQLFMLRGTVVGILDGDIEAFEESAGTARAAPHDALPLLAVLQERADSPRAQYYTEDTSLAEVDRTLSDGKFTGFVELSENVLSGDYYLVYHQGRSMSVAWVGNSSRLVTDEDAFEQADGEVGIYQVMQADIDPIELPDPPESTSGSTAAEPVADQQRAEPAPPGEEDRAAEELVEDGIEEQSSPDEKDRAAEELVEDGIEEQSSPDDDGDWAAEELDEDGIEEQSPPDDDGDWAAEELVEDGIEEQSPSDDDGDWAAEELVEDGIEEQSPPDEEDRDGEADVTAAGDPASAETSDRERDTPDPSGPAADEASSETGVDRRGDEPADDIAATGQREQADAKAGTEATADARPTDAEQATAEPTTDTHQDVEAGEPTTGGAAEESSATPAAPAGESADTDPASADGTAPDSTDGDETIALETRAVPSLDPELSSTAPQTTADPAEPAAEASDAGTSEPSRQQREAVSRLQAEVDEREERIDRLEGELAETRAENEELAAERDRLVAELEEARAEIQRLEDRLESIDTPATGERQLSAAEAIDGTNLFVRYHSKGEATLSSAQEGSADRAAVEENLRLEYHTQFDASDAVVDGHSFETFLQESIHYRFVDWLVRGLLYEIRDTGHGSEMGVLYEALPAIDRAELNGKVSVTYTEDGQEHRSQETFDVAVRDRMGNPLIVANINDSREPATDGQMTDLVRTAGRVGDNADSLSAAFLVTSSFFEPEALETATEATASGLFSRDKRKSFVNLSRKGGYHLCLLEARNREFHLAVPEL